MNNAPIEEVSNRAAPEPPEPRNMNAPFPPDDIAEQHAHDSGSVAPSRAEQPYIALRSATMWALLLFTLAAMGALGFMIFHVRSTTTHLEGPNDKPALEQPGYKGQ